LEFGAWNLGFKGIGTSIIPILQGNSSPETPPLTLILSPLKRGEGRGEGNFICF